MIFNYNLCFWLAFNELCSVFEFVDMYPICYILCTAFGRHAYPGQLTFVPFIQKLIYVRGLVGLVFELTAFQFVVQHLNHWAMIATIGICCRTYASLKLMVDSSLTCCWRSTYYRCIFHPGKYNLMVKINLMEIQWLFYACDMCDARALVCPR